MPVSGSAERLTHVRSRDGTAIACWRSGRGRPIVLVHGTTADHRRWRAVRPLLEPHASVWAVDRRGRGASGDAAAYTVEREFEDVAAVIDAAGEPADVLGHSFGAVCALGAATLTANVRRLVLYEPPVTAGQGPAGEDQAGAGAAGDLAERLEALLAEGERERLLEVFFREEVGMGEEQLRRFRGLPDWPERIAAAHTLVRELRAVRAYRLERDRLAAVTAPALLLTGTASPAAMQAASAAVAAALPAARLERLEGQEHIPMDTAPALLADRVLGFLSGGGSRA